jgi:hypothetical protein
MSIKALALDLYRSQKEVDRLKQLLEDAESLQEKNRLQDELRLARAELQLIRKMLDGKKKSSLSRTKVPFSKYGR